MELPGQTNLQTKFLTNKEIAMIWCGYRNWCDWYGRD